MKRYTRTVNIVDNFTIIMIKHVINVELSVVSSSFFTALKVYELPRRIIWKSGEQDECVTGE